MSSPTKALVTPTNTKTTNGSSHLILIPKSRPSSKKSRRRRNKERNYSPKTPEPLGKGRQTRKTWWKRNWVWKYTPVLIMFIAMAVTWLKTTPEGQKLEVSFQKNAEEIKMELESWLDKQLAQYQASMRDARERLTHTIFDSSDPEAATDIGWVLNTPEHKFTMNKTRQFWDFFDSPIPTTDLMPLDLKDDIFVYIPGLFTQWYPGYMRDLIAAMDAMKFETHFCTLNTAASVSENAKVIADAIFNLTVARPEKKVVLLGHSKGALDAATAFVLYPDIIPKISAFIAFQAPWGGSAIANDILSAHHRRTVSSAFVEKVLNGNSLALTGITYAERKKWLQQHPFPLGAVPTLSVATYETSFKSLLKAPIDYIRIRYDELSDGCVATRDSIIPGTVLVELPGMDHFGPAYHGFPACCRGMDPARVQMGLLNVLFHR